MLTVRSLVFNFVLHYAFTVEGMYSVYFVKINDVVELNVMSCTLLYKQFSLLLCLWIPHSWINKMSYLMLSDLLWHQLSRNCNHFCHQNTVVTLCVLLSLSLSPWINCQLVVFVLPQKIRDYRGFVYLKPFLSHNLSSKASMVFRGQIVEIKQDKSRAHAAFDARC